MKNMKMTVVTAIVYLLLSTAASKAGYVVPTNGLIGYWPGNGIATDVSPTGNNGTFTGNYVPGPTGKLAFDLGTAKVSIPNNAAYNFTSYACWSVGFWFNGNAGTVNNANGLFLGQDNGAGYKPKWFIDYGYTVYVGNNDWYNFHVNDYNQERIFVSSPSEPSPTGWNQLTVTINNTNNGTVTFYLNGQLIGAAQMGNYVLETTAPLMFGVAEGLSFSGLMSDVVIYNRLLSTNEILRLATAPFSITSEVLDGNGHFVISWQSVPGVTYQVVAATSINEPITWSDIGSAVVATNTLTSATVPVNSLVNFYRVKIP
jgi:hypothetical protein